MDRKRREAIVNGQKRIMRDIDYTVVLVRRLIESAAAQIIHYSYNNESIQRDRYETFKVSDMANRELLKYTVDATHDIVREIFVTAETVSKGIERKWIGTITKREFNQDAFLASLIFGKTMEDRVTEYFGKLKNELTLFIRGGFKHDISERDLIDDFLKHKDFPFKSEIAALAITEGLGSLKGMSASRSIARVVDDVAVRGTHAINGYYWRKAKEKEIVSAKDSHVCGTCNDLDGRRFPMDENVLPVHNGCRCVEIPYI